MQILDTPSRKESMRPPKRALYVGPFRFPDGDAGAQRVFGIGRALRATGMEVEFCGWSKPAHGDSEAAETFDGFRFRNVPEFRKGNEGAIGRLRHHLFEGKLTLKWLKETATDNDVVIVYNWYGIYVAKVIAWCRSRKIPVLVDSVEWYDPRQCAGGSFGLVRWEVDWCLNNVFRRANGVIAISSFLMKHFGSTTPTLRVPPLVDVRDEKWNVKPQIHLSDGPINIAYCGVPGRKDNLSHLFDALAQMGERNRRFCVTLIGPENSRIEAMLNGIDGRRFRNLSCRGRLPHLDAIRELAQSDYSLLIRPDRRYAHAGFSTKLVESLAVGTPPFCNVTSDIMEYTTDGEDCVHIRSDASTDVLDGLNRIDRISREEHTQMRQAAKFSAARNFDWRNYVEKLGTFVSDTANKSQQICASRF